MRAIIALLLLFPSTLLAADLTIPAGEVVEIQSGDYDTVTVEGTWKAKRGESTAITVETIIVDGGTLDLGTPESPLCCPFSIVIKDVAPTMELPHLGAEGNVGIVAIRGGTLLACGVPKLPFWESPSPLRVGQTELALEDGHGWQVGDRLWIPSFKQQDEFQNGRELWHETPHEFREYMIAKIDCGIIKLDRPISEDVYPTRCFGQVTQLPLVVNLSRNIVIQSQNPEGNRGHIAAAGAASGIDFRWVEVRDMGRTVGKLIRNDRGQAIKENGLFMFEPSVIGRYPLHMHHMGDSDTPRHIEGCVVDGSGISKWGIVAHQTHYATITDSVCYNLHGSGFVCEDQNEFGCLFSGNVAGNITAEHDDTRRGLEGTPSNPLRGFEGAGFWCGGFSEFTNNIAVNCQHGFEYPGQVFGDIAVQIFGSKLFDTPEGSLPSRPLEFAECVAVSCSEGFEFWRAQVVGSGVLNGCVSANCSQKQVDPNKEGVTLKACQLSCDPQDITDVFTRQGWISGRRMVAMFTNEAYTSRAVLTDTDIDGCLTGLFTARIFQIDNVRIRSGIGVVLGPSGHPSPDSQKTTPVKFTAFPELDCAVGNYAIRANNTDPWEFADEVPWLLIEGE